MRRGQRRVHANVRAVSVPRDPLGTGHSDRPRLRACGKRMRVQAKGLGPTNGSRAGRHYSSGASPLTRFQVWPLRLRVCWNGKKKKTKNNETSPFIYYIINVIL